MKCQSSGTNFQTLLCILESHMVLTVLSKFWSDLLCLSCQPVPQSVLDEMMVEQTDLVRLRLVRMSNVPDTLYMVNNAVPQCCHMINHQQMASTSAAAPSVVANEIPGKEIVKRLITALAFMLKYKQLNHPYT